LLRLLIKTARRYKHVGNALPAPAKAAIADMLTKLHSLHHGRMYRRMVSRAGFADLETAVCRTATPMTAPLALISQIERSGGTLLSQLFDGHPAVAAYPHELRIGWEDSGDTFPAELSSFRSAADLQMQKQLKHGFRKGRHSKPERFLISPRIQKLIFESIEKRTPRDSYDAFFTAFFNAWMNYKQDLQNTTLITAFAPRLAVDPDNVARFFSVYPDGFLIQVTRDFESWSRSAGPFYEAQGRPKSQEQLKRLWTENAASIERNKSRYGDRVLTVALDDLRSDPAATMTTLSRALGLAYDPVLEQPTFNGRLTWANSSFSVNEPGLLKSAPTSRPSA
jgi:hypothetical protein